jgi:ubiquitin conjugation factor E4 B
MIKNLQIIDQEIKAQQINYDDAPEEFCDPITTVLMEDPVLLPTSNIIVDRSTIVTHLLSDPTDPFNRKSLKIEDLVSCSELKEKIDIYKLEKLNKNK